MQQPALARVFFREECRADECVRAARGSQDLSHGHECLWHKLQPRRECQGRRDLNREWFGLRVNKTDSPRISEDIHIDRKQPHGVSLKGSSLALLGAGETTSFEELQGFLGYLKSAAQAECYRVFDKKVERASREIKRGLWPE
jgi:hypothetical protein